MQKADLYTKIVRMDLFFTIHFLVDYDNWYEAFLADAPGRAQWCDDKRTVVGKVDNQTAMVICFDVDIVAMGVHMQSDAFLKLAEGVVVRHDIYQLQSLVKHDIGSSFPLSKNSEVV